MELLWVKEVRAMAVVVRRRWLSSSNHRGVDTSSMESSSHGRTDSHGRSSRWSTSTTRRRGWAPSMSACASWSVKLSLGLRSSRSTRHGSWGWWPLPPWNSRAAHITVVMSWSSDAHAVAVALLRNTNVRGLSAPLPRWYLLQQSLATPLCCKVRFGKRKRRGRRRCVGPTFFYLCWLGCHTSESKHLYYHRTWLEWFC